MLQEALPQEDLTQSEFSTVLDNLQDVARDTNVKVSNCTCEVKYIVVVCVQLFLRQYSAGCAVVAFLLSLCCALFFAPASDNVMYPSCVDLQDCYAGDCGRSEGSALACDCLS